MGNCCGGPEERTPLSSSDLQPSRGVDRQRVLEAAERRNQAEASRGIKGEVRLPRSYDEGPNFGGNEGGLRWQVG